MMNIEEFKRLYGVDGLTRVLQEFLEKAPPFPGEGRLAIQLGKMVADLESALKEVK